MRCHSIPIRTVKILTVLILTTVEMWRNRSFIPC